jgi:putative endonuclease
MRPEGLPTVYILASRPYGTLYTGVTSELCNRVADHRSGRIPGFTRDYGVKMLVHYAYFGTMDEAIRREKQIKEWKRAWKVRLIEEDNPRWIDLFPGLCGPDSYEDGKPVSVTAKRKTRM